MSSKFKFERYDAEEFKKQYNDFYRQGDFKSYSTPERFFISSLIRKFRLKPGTKIIDVGCGTGKYSNLLTKFGMKTLGIDISDEAIRHAQDRYPQSRFKVADVTQSDIEQNSYDVIFCSGLSLFNEENLDTLLPFMDYLLKVLKNSGLFIFVKTSSLTDTHSKNKTRIDYSIDSLENFFNKISALQQLDSSGTYPHVFPFLRTFGFARLITFFSTVNTKITGIPVRVCIVLKKINIHNW